MTRTTNKLIGDIGETISKKILKDLGYDLVGFGKAMKKSNKFDFLSFSLNTVPDRNIGYSYGNFPFHLSPDYSSEWRDAKHPHWSDLPNNQIIGLASICRAKYEKCPIKINTPDHAPCKCVDKFLDKTWLTSISPYNPAADLIDKNGQLIKLHGFQVIHWCLKRLVKILIEENKSTPPYNKGFILTNLIISNFLEKSWRKYIDNNKLPHSPEAIRLAFKNGGVAEEERLKNENRAALKSFPGNDFPGRYDFIGFKDNKIYAIEVKVNTSKISHWQFIRLSLLERFGCNVMRFNLTLSDDEIRQAMSGELHNHYRYTISELLPNSKIIIPTDIEFIEVMNYIPDYSNPNIYE